MNGIVLPFPACRPSLPALRDDLCTLSLQLDLFEAECKGADAAVRLDMAEVEIARLADECGRLAVAVLAAFPLGALLGAALAIVLM